MAPSAAATSGSSNARPVPLGSSPSPSSLTPDLRSDINGALLDGGHIEKIHAHLLSTVHSTTWPSNIRTLCLSLLRSGEAHTFPTLLKLVQERVAAANTNASPGAARGSGDGDENADGHEADASSRKKEKEKEKEDRKKGNTAMTNGKKVNGTASTSTTSHSSTLGSGNGNGPSDKELRIPKRVVDEGHEVVREALLSVVEVD